jgi:hypothetical protein
MLLFIDTNIFLSFYKFTDEDLEQLEKIIKLIDSKAIILIITEQVVDEFKRNRESVISDMIKNFRGHNHAINFPCFCKNYQEYEEIRESTKNIEKLHKELLRKVQKAAKDKTFHADKILQSIFEKGSLIKSNDFIIKKANLRRKLGNPPGKKDSIGDAINWECLLSIEEDSDLYLISADGDYESQLSDESIKEYLSEEWKSKRTSSIFLYNRISKFFRDKFPHIILSSAEDTEKDILIDQLTNSSCFSYTHDIISKLLNLFPFNASQVEKIMEAFEYNSQVGWISTDQDLQEFLISLRDNPSKGIKPETQEKIENLIVQDEEDPS